MMEAEAFKAVRRRYYQLGKDRAYILVEMGYIDPRIMGPEPMKSHEEKRFLMKINEDERVDELIGRINEREKSQVPEEAGIRGGFETQRGPVSER